MSLPLAPSPPSPSAAASNRRRPSLLLRPDGVVEWATRRVFVETLAGELARLSALSARPAIYGLIW